MKAAIAVLVILVIIAAIFGGMYVGRKNQMVISTSKQSNLSRRSTSNSSAAPTDSPNSI